MTFFPTLDKYNCDCMRPKCPYCDVDGSREKARDELIEKINKNKWTKQTKLNYLQDYCEKAMLFSSGMERFIPDIGHCVAVDDVEISQNIFPQEYAEIRSALDSVLKKLRDFQIQNEKKLNNL